MGILIDGLRKNGCVVEEINRPLMLSTAQRVEILKKPWKLFSFAWNLLGLWRGLRRDARAWMKRNGRPDAVLVGYMGHFDVLLAHHVFKGVPIILDHLIFAGDTAKDRGAQGLKVKLLRRLDRMAIDAATLTLLDTQEHQAMCQPGDETMVVPVGAPDEWYAAGAAQNGATSTIDGNTAIAESNQATSSAIAAGQTAEADPAAAQRKPRTNDVVFYGLYTPLQGVPVIAQAAKELASRGITSKFTLIGKGQDYVEVRRIADGLDNVEFREWVEPEELPALVASHAISLGIFSTTPKGLHVVPNKVYQSMAAGCAVITSDTAPQRRMLGDGVVYVKPGDATALADAIERLLADPAALRAAQAAAVTAAGSFTDDKITRPLAEWVRAHTR
ncbi:glycosyltransferase [Bifidobacterium biavatii]|uniref:glycosyltransferase n=1 Tax=Bifidobacterium biavatii TaxID=762212 RepID=UPI00068A65C7|nr:glycosyltransferase [Bifidobacterium biavatii]